MRGDKDYNPANEEKACCNTISPMGRQSAAQRLRDQARYLRDKAHGLELLADQVSCLSAEADAALFDLACSIR